MAERKISWLEDISEAKRLSGETGKPILMFFHYEHCNGCINTIAKTLPKMSVIDMVTENYVPLMLDIEVRKDETTSYSVEWTPTFIVADDSGLEIRRWVGYLPEDDFLSQLNLSMAMTAFRKGDFKDAERHFDEVVIKFPLTDLAAEAVYYQGVARYKSTNDVSMLTKTHENLKEAYPESIWATKASVWSAEQMKKAA